MGNIRALMYVMLIIVASAAAGYVLGTGITTLAERITGGTEVAVQTSVLQKQGPFEVRRTEMYELIKEGSNYNVYFGNTIGHAHLYEDLIRGLHLLTENDTVIMHLSNLGGSVHTGMQIMTALDNTRAHIISKVNSPSYSMGAVIACAADDIQLSPYAFLMYHDFSGNFSGKANESLHHIIAIRVMLTDTLMNTCVKKGVLTSDEALLVFEGVDIYIHTIGER